MVLWALVWLMPLGASARDTLQDIRFGVERIANNHASKTTLLRFREGTASDTIDAVLAVEDRDPQV